MVLHWTDFEAGRSLAILGPCTKNTRFFIICGIDTELVDRHLKNNNNNSTNKVHARTPSALLKFSLTLIPVKSWQRRSLENVLREIQNQAYILKGSCISWDHTIIAKKPKCLCTVYTRCSIIIKICIWQVHEIVRATQFYSTDMLKAVLTISR